MLQKQSGEDPEESGSEYIALFDPTADVEEFRGAAIELHSPLHVTVEGLNQALQVGWAANLGQDSEEAFSTDEIKRLGEIDKSNIQGHLLFSALLLELVEGEVHVYH